MFQFRQPVLVLIAFVVVTLLTSFLMQTQTELFAQIGPGVYPSTPGGVGRPGGTPTFPRMTLPPTPSIPSYQPPTSSFSPPTPSYTPSTPSYTPSTPSSSFPSSFPSSGSNSFGPPQSILEYTCSKCGKEITASAIKCPHCGVLFTHTEYLDGSGPSGSTSPFFSSSSSQPSNAQRGFVAGIIIGGALLVFIIIGGTIALIVTLVVKAGKPKPQRSYGVSPGYANQQYGNPPSQYPNQYTSRPPTNPNQFR